MSKIHITTKVNGEEVEFLADPRDTLLDCLRDQLELTGTKEGCSTGDCGACSVTVDGTLVCSCLMLGVEAQDKQIETIEGMAQDGELHPLQRKFIEHAALQCGFCTPGILVAAKALLAKNPDPNETEVMVQDGELHPLQRKFIEHAALQCGFCTPGILVAAKALLAKNPDPNETEVRYWLAGNLCRCTGYDKIIRAVMDAAAEMRGAA